MVTYCEILFHSFFSLYVTLSRLIRIHSTTKAQRTRAKQQTTCCFHSSESTNLRKNISPTNSCSSTQTFKYNFIASVSTFLPLSFILLLLLLRFPLLLGSTFIHSVAYSLKTIIRPVESCRQAGRQAEEESLLVIMNLITFPKKHIIITSKWPPKPPPFVSVNKTGCRWKLYNKRITTP